MEGVGGVFFFNDTATTEIYTLSLHDALPISLLQVCLRAAESAGTGKLDPAKWGSDHVGKEVPEYMTGGECLFCHGKKVGVNWQRNPHQLTMRLALPDSDEVKALATFLKAGEKPEYLQIGRAHV